VDDFLVCTSRRGRQDGLFLRKVPSAIGNRLIRRITGLDFKDLGCSLKAFRADVLRTKAILEDLVGTRVIGYRAPSYSIDARNLWALDVLQETGHEYSSSIYPIRHDLYGMPDAPRFAFRFRAGGLLELPVTTVRLGERNLPCGGGGFFRLLPYPLFRGALRRVNRLDCQPGIFYFHPWEVDPDQPRVANAPLKSRFRHYVNLSTMERRLEQLLGDFRWGRMDEVFLAAPVAASVPGR